MAAMKGLVKGLKTAIEPLLAAHPPARALAARNPRLRPVSIATQRRCIHCSSRRRRQALQTASSKAASPGHHSKSTRTDASSFKDPTTRYNHLVEIGALKPDDHQAGIIRKLQRLWNDLENYDPGAIPPEPTVESPGLLGRFFGSGSSEPGPSKRIEDVPKGLYLYGSVGTGKTMLMDLFYSTLPPQFSPKRYGSTRIHFHNFMLEVQKRQHEITKRYEASGLTRKDALPEVARSLAAEGRVLCFDEFQVTDIVTAMLLRGLLERLMGFGVVCVMTSNRHPDELYLNGIQRQSFIPAIELLKEKFQVVDLDSETDYRKMPKALSHTYYHPLSQETHLEMSKLFESLTSADPVSTEIVENRELPLWGRRLKVPESSGSIAKFTFDDLCGKPLSAADYIEVTNAFGTVFVENVPRMGLSERDMARRFITFIDACYENKTKLFISSEVPIFQVFSNEKGSSAADDQNMRHIMDDLGLSADEIGSSSLFSGDEELFAFARCVSRLSQMGTQEWSEQSGLQREPPRSEVSETD